MNDLGNNVKELAVKYLLAEMRDYRGSIDRNKQAKELVRLLNVECIEKLFYSGKEKDDHLKIEYQVKLEKLFSYRNERDIDSLNTQKHEIYEQIVSEVLEKTNDEGKAQGSANNSWELNKQIADLRAIIEFGKPASAVTFWDRLNSRVNLPYLIILMLVVVLIGGLVLIGMTANMTVNVDFSVGEIIGGLLVGTGVAAAGVSYATRDKVRENNEKG